MQTPTTLGLVFAVSAVVALPSLLAIVRKHPHWLAITIFDVLFGWTVVGWLFAFAWVLRPAKRRQPRRELALKTRSAAGTRTKAAKREPAAGETAANDNRSLPSLADAAPPALPSNVYEDWLETGGALSGSAPMAAETGRVAATPARPAAASTPKAAA